MKIHFGSGNDSSEDYYYLKIGDATTKSLGLRDTAEGAEEISGEKRYEDVIQYPPFSELNDFNNMTDYPHGRAPFDINVLEQGKWYCGTLATKPGFGSENTMLLIKRAHGILC